MKNIMEHYFYIDGKYFLYNYDKTVFYENQSHGEWFNHSRNMFLERILLNKISYKELFNSETVYDQFVLFFIKTNVIEDCFDFINELIIFSAKNGVWVQSVIDMMFYLTYNVKLDTKVVKRMSEFVGLSHFKLYTYLMFGINDCEQYILDNCPNDVFVRLFTRCDFKLEEAENKYSLLTL